MNDALRLKLLHMRDLDQKMRESKSLNTSIDKINTIKLKKIVATFGWPDENLVGKDGAEAAWLIVQHADHDVRFQIKCLGLMRKKLKKKIVSPINVVYLFDRVNVNLGKRQRYGTQFQFDKKKQILIPRPIGDKNRLDARRKNIGLEPFDVYQKRLQNQQRKLAK